MPWFFITFIFFTLWLNWHIANSDKELKNMYRRRDEYIKANIRAAYIPAQPLDEHMIIRLMEKDLPFRVYSPKERGAEDSISYDLQKVQDKVKHHLSAPLIKTNIPTNLEIKERFGNDNLRYIVNGEENFIRLLHYMNKWARLLIESGNAKDAEWVLQKAIDIGSDISETYVLLYQLYQSSYKEGAIASLTEKINALPQITQERIYKTVQHSGSDAFGKRQ